MSPSPSSLTNNNNNNNASSNSLEQHYQNLQHPPNHHHPSPPNVSHPIMAAFPSPHHFGLSHPATVGAGAILAEDHQFSPEDIHHLLGAVESDMDRSLLLHQQQQVAGMSYQPSQYGIDTSTSNSHYDNNNNNHYMTTTHNNNTTNNTTTNTSMIPRDDKLQARTERKRSREKQRRSDVNQQFEQLVQTMRRVESTFAATTTTTTTPKESIATSASASLAPTTATNRVDLLNRTIALLEQLTVTCQQRQAQVTDLEQRLAQAQQAGQEAAAKLKESAEQMQKMIMANSMASVMQQQQHGTNLPMGMGSMMHHPMMMPHHATMGMPQGTTSTDKMHPAAMMMYVPVMYDAGLGCKPSSEGEMNNVAEVADNKAKDASSSGSDNKVSNPEASSSLTAPEETSAPVLTATVLSPAPAPTPTPMMAAPHHQPMMHWPMSMMAVPTSGGPAPAAAPHHQQTQSTTLMQPPYHPYHPYGAPTTHPMMMPWMPTVAPPQQQQQQPMHQQQQSLAPPVMTTATSTVPPSVTAVHTDVSAATAEAAATEDDLSASKLGASPTGSSSNESSGNLAHCA